MNSSQHLTVSGITTNNGRLIANGGTLTFEGGLTNNADVVLVDNTVHGNVTTPVNSTMTLLGQVQFMDAVSGAGNFYGPGEAVFASSYSPGDSPAVVSMEGDLQLGSNASLMNGNRRD